MKVLLGCRHQEVIYRKLRQDGSLEVYHSQAAVHFLLPNCRKCFPRQPRFKKLSEHISSALHKLKGPIRYLVLTCFTVAYSTSTDFQQLFYGDCRNRRHIQRSVEAISALLRWCNNPWMISNKRIGHVISE